MVKEVREGDFEEEVLGSDIPAVVDFWAPWCGPCRFIGPIIDRLSIEYEGKIKFCKLNVDENPSIALRYGVRSIPLLIFFSNGNQRDQLLGAVPEAVIRPKLEALLSR